MLVELGLVEQRYQAVLEVLVEAKPVSEVARERGVTCHSVHRWLRRYAAQGLSGLVDQPSKPVSCPHQMDPVVEWAIVQMRREHPGWGPRTIGVRLARGGVDPVPGRSSIYRCLVRHGLIEPQAGGGNGRITSGGSGRGPWSCGRWTSWVGSAWATGRRSR